MHIIIATLLLKSHTEKHPKISRIKVDLCMISMFTNHKTMTMAKKRLLNLRFLNC